METVKAFLLRLHANLNILREREAKFGGNAPLDLLNQIEDHERASELTEQRINGMLGEREWREALRPLLVHYYFYVDAFPRQSELNPDEEGGGSPDLFPPARHMIGRKKELAHLQARLERLVQKRQGWIVFITGRPGYGRQALARTLAETAQAQGTPVIVGRFKPRGRVSSEAATAVWQDDPFIGPALAEYGERLQAFWPQACRLGGVSWLAMVAQIARQLGYAPSPSEQGIADKPEVIKRLLRVAARRRPSVWLLENLDVGQDYWVDLLKYMAAEIGRDLPVLVVATVKADLPLEKLAGEQWGEALHLANTLEKAGQAETLWLDRVSRAEVEEYITSAEAKLGERLHFLADGVPVLVESLWREWVEVEAVKLDRWGQWVATSQETWWVFGDSRDHAYQLLTECLVEEGPFSQVEVETMLSYGAMEGYTFTAQAVARAMGLDSDAVQDFWDEQLLETEEVYGLLVDAGFTRVIDGGRERQFNLYRFASPYLWQVWAKYPAGLGAKEARRLAEALEVIYYPEAERVAGVLIQLWERSGQKKRAEAYRRRREQGQSLERLRWQVALLAEVSSDLFEQYRMVDLRLELSWRLYEVGQYKEGYGQAKAALGIVQEWHDREREVWALNLVGINQYAQGEYREARPYFERALAICEKVLGPEHPDTASSLNGLALLLQAQGDYGGARPYFERALAIREKVLGPEHPDTASSLNGLAFLLHAQGEYMEARPYFERALAIREKVLGAEHPDTAISLNGLARLLKAQGDYGGARPYFERALAICEKVLGPEHPHTAISLNSLARLLKAQGDYGGARPYFERALAICEKVLGPEHPHTRIVRSNLSSLSGES